MNIAIICCIHGNELFGLDFKSFFNINADDDIRKSVTFFTANTKAVSENKRFIDADMNRVFGKEQNSYESKRSLELIPKIDNFDLILDIHNTNTKVKNTPIIASRSYFLLNLLKYHPSREIVIMNDKVSSGSLIGIFNQKAISLEYSRDYCKDKKSLEEIMQLIRGALKNNVTSYPTKNLYYVERKIALSESTKYKRNFYYNKDFKGYPFLVGNNTYKNEFQGFLATKKEKILLDKTIY